MQRCLVAIAILATAREAMSQQPPNVHPPKGLRASLDPSLPAYVCSESISGQIRSIGTMSRDSTTMMGLWHEAFAKVNPNIRMIVEQKGPPKVIPALIEGRSDIGPLNRELTRSEIAAFEQKFGYKPMTVCVAGGSWRTRGMTHALAIVVNRTNPIERLSLDQLDSIYSKSRKRGYKEGISTWGQLGLKGEWANRSIKLYGMMDTQGGTGGIMNFFQARILLDGEYKDGITHYMHPAVEKLVEAVSQDPAGIGPAGFGDVEANPNVKSVAIAETQAGPYYEGSFDDVVSRRYPLTRFIYIYVNRAPGKPLDPAIGEFLRFVLSKEGQQLVQEEGHYIPLSAAMVKQERAKLEADR